MPLSRSEVTRFKPHPKTLEESLFSGSYPRIFDKRLDPSDWLASYVASYLERDVRTMTNVGDLSTFQRFVELCAGRTGQLLNYSALAGDCGITQPTARSWLSVLETSFLAFRLQPFHSNLRKRLVKMPKLHFYDSGLVCWLLGIREASQLRSHPLRGAIFESWVVSEILKRRANRGESRRLSFYRDRDGAEVDVVVEHSDRLELVEAKSAETASSSLFAAASRVKRHLDTGPMPCEVVAVYGGDRGQRRSEASLVSWSGVGDRSWER